MAHIKTYISNGCVQVTGRFYPVSVQPMPTNHALPIFHPVCRPTFFDISYVVQSVVQSYGNPFYYNGSHYYYICDVIERKRVGKNTFLERVHLTGEIANKRPGIIFKAWVIKENGLIHNTKGPAIYSDERDFFVFMIKGQHHRDGDLPALIDKKENHKEYWIDGKRSRLGGPAIERGSIGSNDYHFEYYVDDMLHRTTGPAIIDIDGTRKFAIAGKVMTEAEHILTVNKEITQEVLDKAIAVVRTNKDFRLFKNALKKAGYSSKSANRFLERIKLLKTFAK